MMAKSTKKQPAEKAPKTPKAAAKPAKAPPKTPAQPLDVQDLANITRVGSKWSLATEWTPQRIGAALKEAVQGNAQDYLTLAIDVEERYLHYASVIQTRKLAVTGVEPEVVSGDASSAGQTIADEFKVQVVDTECFYELCTDLLDSLSKGYSVCQPIWDTKATSGGKRFWTPKEYQFVDQRMFRYDPETMTQLRIDDGSAEGIEIEDEQFIIHSPKIRSGIQIRTGLARAACIGYMFQSPAVKNWASFAEVFGMPLRVGKYDPLNAGPAEIAKLRTAIVNLAFDAACVIPDDMKLEILDGRRPASGDNVFEGLARFWDEQISKLVLGQTMTADNGSSEAQAKIHNLIRINIAKADARSLSATIRDQVAAPWVRFNYGLNAPVPRVKFNVEPPEDLVSFADGLVPFINAGLQVDSNEVRDKFGLSRPSSDADVIRPWSNEATAATGALPVTASRRVARPKR